MNAAALRRSGFIPRLTFLLSFVLAPFLVLTVNAQSLAEIKIAAEAGDPAAQHKLAEAHASRMDSMQSEVWYRKAAAQGHIQAQAKLGKMLLMRSRTSFSSPPADRAAQGAEAIKWLLLSANQGERDAQAELASVYVDGKLVALDLAEAYKWGDLAAKGSPLHAATITGRSRRDAAVLKMPPDQIEEARKRVASFVPRQFDKSNLPAAPAPAWLQQIKLKGISGALGNRFALINNQTLKKGDASPIKIGTNTVTLRCLEIRDKSVTVSIDGLNGTTELTLP
jgi:hypothetical protein